MYEQGKFSTSSQLARLYSTYSCIINEREQKSINYYDQYQNLLSKTCQIQSQKAAIIKQKDCTKVANSNNLLILQTKRVITKQLNTYIAQIKQRQQILQVTLIIGKGHTSIMHLCHQNGLILDLRPGKTLKGQYIGILKGQRIILADPMGQNTMNL